MRPLGDFAFIVSIETLNGRISQYTPASLTRRAMSHGDHVTEVPPGFHVTALTDDALNAMEDGSRGIYGVQFHPEVAHTPLGAQVLRNFLFSVCGCRGDWSPEAVIEEQVERIRA